MARSLTSPDPEMAAMLAIASVGLVLPSRCAPPQLSLAAPQTPKTVGDAKVAFQQAYGRPVGGVQQGFVAELLTSSVVAMVSPSYLPSRVTSVGFEALCKEFLTGAVSDEEREKLRTSLIYGLGQDASSVSREATEMAELASTCGSEDALFATEDFKTLAAATNFKYSYSFGAGLFTLMPLVGQEPSDEVIERWCGELNLPSSRVKKDWAFYVDATRKLVEVKQMILQMAAQSKRKEAAKLKEEADKAAAEASEAEGQVSAEGAAEAKD